MPQHHDVLIVGGGPGGSTCAWRLRRAGIDVAVVDKAQFPRDKVCAGWITPQVIADLDLDIEQYRSTRVFQPILGFVTGLTDGPAMEVRYDEPVSYGIRRCEFDTYLLRRSGAGLITGCPVERLERSRDGWLVNGELHARMLVGAGGHFCPVARLLGAHTVGSPVVRAQETEFALPASDFSSAVNAEVPELYFCPDLAGYGWCFRKGDFLNVGFGRTAKYTQSALREFVDGLRRRGRLDGNLPAWRGHAYRLMATRPARFVDDRVLLAGDAAGLAYPQSGEGIRPAIESGLLAAETILASAGDYRSARLERYQAALIRRFAVGRTAQVAARVVPHGLAARIVPRIFLNRRLTRHIVLDRWFLRRGEAPMNTPAGAEIRPLQPSAHRKWSLP